MYRILIDHSAESGNMVRSFTCLLRSMTHPYQTHSNQRHSFQQAHSAQPDEQRFTITKRDKNVWESVLPKLTAGQRQALEETLFQQTHLFHHEVFGAEHFEPQLSVNHQHKQGGLFILNHDIYTLGVMNIIAYIIEKTQRSEDIIIVTADAILAAKIKIAGYTMMNPGNWFKHYGCTAPPFHQLKQQLLEGKIVIVFPGGEHEWINHPHYKKSLNPKHPGIPQVCWTCQETDAEYNQGRHAHKHPKGIWPGERGDRNGFLAAIIEIFAEEKLEIPIFPVTSPNAENLFDYNALGFAITRWLSKTRQIFWPFCSNRGLQFQQLPHFVPNKNVEVITQIGPPIFLTKPGHQDIPSLSLRVIEQIHAFYRTEKKYLRQIINQHTSDTPLNRSHTKAFYRHYKKNLRAVEPYQSHLKQCLVAVQNRMNEQMIETHALTAQAVDPEEAKQRKNFHHWVRIKTLSSLVSIIILSALAVFSWS